APGSSGIAMAGVISPFGGQTWPQQTLRVLDEGNTPLKLGGGDAFTLSVKVRPGDRVPASARATYRFADGAEAVEPLRTFEGGEFRGRIEAVHQPFQFTVTGGGDATPLPGDPLPAGPPPPIKAPASPLGAA